MFRLSLLLLVFVSAAGNAAPGDVLSLSKISSTSGNFAGTLDLGDRFGHSIASLGDFDGNGVGDIAVGARFDDDGGSNRGAVWLLFLEADGTVGSHAKISSTSGDFTGQLDNDDYFGIAVESLGDLDGDGVTDLAVGAMGDDDGGPGRGAVWVLFLNPNGTVRDHAKIASAVIAGVTEGFNGSLSDHDSFGYSIARLGDVNGDGVVDLCVGAFNDDDAAPASGAVWVLMLDLSGGVTRLQEISGISGGLDGVLGQGDRFGKSVTSLGDFNGDGVPDVAVGAYRDSDGGLQRGAAYMLFLDGDGTVSTFQKISSTTGGFAGALDDEDNFGSAVAHIGDVDDDGVSDLAVAAYRDDDGGMDRGAVWILFMNANGTVRTHMKHGSFSAFAGLLEDGELLAERMRWIGDFDGDGTSDLVAGVVLDGDGGFEKGAVWVVELEVAGLVDVPDSADPSIGGPLRVVQNPVRAREGILFETSSFGIARLYDVAGREVGRSDVEGPGPALFDLGGGFESLSPGVYFLRFATPFGVSASEKVVIVP